MTGQLPAGEATELDRQTSGARRLDSSRHSGRDAKILVDSDELGDNAPRESRLDSQPPLGGDVIVEHLRIEEMAQKRSLVPMQGVAHGGARVGDIPLDVARVRSLDNHAPHFRPGLVRIASQFFVAFDLGSFAISASTSFRTMKDTDRSSESARRRNQSTVVFGNLNPTWIVVDGFASGIPFSGYRSVTHKAPHPS